jgi:hypothetical protein
MVESCPESKHCTEHGGAISHSVHTLLGTDEVVERIQLLLARFPEDEATVRRLVATDASFDALSHEYCKVIGLLDSFEAEVKRLRNVIERLNSFETEVKRLTQLRASLEEELLTRIEGYQPQ